MFKDLVDGNGLSCYKLSQISGISYTTINEIYRGERLIDECSLRVVRKLSDAFNISLSNFIDNCEKRIDIPSSLYKCFWDVDVSKLNLLKDKVYIITRLLEKGGYLGLVFIKNAYSYEEIKSVAKSTRNLSPKIASFLKNVFHLKDSEMAFYTKNIKDWR